MADIALLNVTMNGRQIGTLTNLPGDRTLFVFDDAYVADQVRPVLSLSFRDVYGDLITDIKPTQTRVPPFFANLLPEGGMRDYLAGRAGVHPQREFFLLRVLGRDLPGAIEILPADGTSLPPGFADDSDTPNHSKDEQAALRFSLAGVQLKFSAIQGARGGLTVPVDGTGGSWIVKLPSTAFAHVPENEFAMMELARHVGIDVPNTKLLPIKTIAGLPNGIEKAGPSAFAIRRFDRADDGTRIHIEDFAQVFGVYPEHKYANASYRNIAQVIWAETGEPGITEFIRRLTFNALIGNGDMHLKNWSLIYPDGKTPALAPAYDFVSTIPYIKGDRLALGFADTKAFEEFSSARFSRFAAKARLPGKLVLDTMRETLDLFADKWKKEASGALPRIVRTAINRHLKTLPIWHGD